MKTKRTLHAERTYGLELSLVGIGAELLQRLLADIQSLYKKKKAKSNEKEQMEREEWRRMRTWGQDGYVVEMYTCSKVT